MELIEKQYKDYEPREEVTATVQDEFELEFVIDETTKFLEKSKRKLLVELLKNKSVKEIKKLTALFFEEDDLKDILDYDEKIILEMRDYIDENIEFLKRIKEVLSKENFKELLKLCDFLIEHYISNINVLQLKRMRIENTLKGINYIDGRRDTREEFKDFFDKIIRKYTLHPLEKRKI